MLDANYVLIENEQMFLDTKYSGLEDSQRIQFMIETLRQIDFMKTEYGIVGAIDTVAEFKELYDHLKTSVVDEVQSLQWRLEIMRYLSYSGSINK